MLFKQIYKDDPLLPAFMEECGKRGFYNNTSIEKLKFDYFDHVYFFAGIEDDAIKVFSGVHEFYVEGQTYWRCGFRGATIDADQKMSRNLRINSFNFGINYYLQMQYIESLHGLSNFVHTSNAPESVDGAGRSHAVDRLMKRGVEGVTLLEENFEYLYTKQNVWLLDKDVWKRDFDKYHRNHHSFAAGLIN
jgi:hypothetical protein